ncbi:MAG: pentapeptide repeat-containing protein [Microthrixaceae bacterium]|nr:pentapeptide repeat-containing protein [Microthrixaceae bacterium]
MGGFVGADGGQLRLRQRGETWHDLRCSKAVVAGYGQVVHRRALGGSRVDLGLRLDGVLVSTLEDAQHVDRLGQRLASARFSRARFSRARFSRARFSRARFSGVVALAVVCRGSLPGCTGVLGAVGLAAAHEHREQVLGRLDLGDRAAGEPRRQGEDLAEQRGVGAVVGPVGAPRVRHLSPPGSGACRSVPQAFLARLSAFSTLLMEGQGS